MKKKTELSKRIAEVSSLLNEFLLKQKIKKKFIEEVINFSGELGFEGHVTKNSNIINSFAWNNRQSIYGFDFWATINGRYTQFIKNKLWSNIEKSIQESDEIKLLKKQLDSIIK